MTGVGRRHTRWSHFDAPALHEWLPLISDCMLITCAQVFSAPGVSELMMIKMAASESTCTHEAFVWAWVRARVQME